MKRKIILSICASLIFLLGIYPGMIIYHAASLAINIKKADYAKAGTHAQTILDNTSFLDFSDNYYVVVLRTASQLLITSQETQQLAQTAFNQVFDPKVEFNTPNWEDFYAKFAHTKVLTHRLATLSSDPRFGTLLKLAGKGAQTRDYQELLTKTDQNLNLVQQILDVFPSATGITDSTYKSYTILLQNNMELRPSGGFMGSYLKVTFDSGKLTEHIVQDIYVPDGAIKGHVNPPDPIQEAFQTGEWRLRDSNWDPDFTVAAQAVEWFFDKGGEQTGDGIIALNLNVVSEIINVLGDILVPDYDKKITSENLYGVAQFEAERDFFPGSTQKKDFLQSLVNNLFFQHLDLSADKLQAIASIIHTGLTQKNIQFYFHDQELQFFAESQNWAGRMIWPQIKDATNDYFFTVDANLSSNKANCCIEKSVDIAIKPREDHYEVSSKITYINHNQYERPRPPKFWGGDYENYLRIYIPTRARVTQLEVSNNPEVKSEVKKDSRIGIDIAEYGFFVEVKHKETVEVNLKYLLPKNDQSYAYAQYLQKQSGSPETNYNYTFYGGGQPLQFTQKLVSDTHIKF
jgi:hypothetical protein